MTDEATKHSLAIMILSQAIGVYDDNARDYEHTGNAVSAARFAALRDRLAESIETLRRDKTQTQEPQPAARSVGSVGCA